MKILIISDQFLKIEGKYILGAVNFTNTLKRLSQFGELYACVRDGSKSKNSILVYNDIINDYIKMENICFISKSFIWPSYNTIKLIKDQIKKVDLVVGYVPALNAEVSSFLTHKLKRKYFALMVACPWDGLWNQDWKRKIAAPYRYFLNKIVLRDADYALYVTKEFLQKRYPTKTHNTIGISDVVLEKTNDEILKRRLEKIANLTDGDKIKLATTAMLNIKYKGQRFVLEALKKLKNRGYNNFEYILIGGGDDRELRKYAQELGISDKVTFIGKVTHEEVFKLLDNIDIYVHPSLQEGLPRSVVEAMSRALPCIGARTGAIPELINKEFVVTRKSADEIADKLLILKDKNILKEEAIRNYNKACEFECSVLDNIRNNFYKSIENDFQSK